MKKWYQKSIAVVMAAACLFVGGTIGVARDSLPQLQLTAEAEDKLYTGESDGLQLKYTELENGTIEITKFVDSTSTDIELPAVIDGKSVTSIRDSAFDSYSSLTNIIFPDSLTNIGKEAFGNCYSLTSINIPKNVTSIGKNAFFNCGSVTEITVDSDNSSYTSKDNVLFDKNMETLLICSAKKAGTYNVPNGVMYIGDQVFYDCFSLTNITIPNNITSIGNSMFFNCYSLTNLIIPDNVFDIEWSAFYGCTSLTTITIPEHVISINDSAFSACSCLTEIIVDSNNHSYSSEDGVLFDKELQTIVCYPAGKKQESFTIPDSVRSIGERAFYKCTGLKSITIPDSVESIGVIAFSDCSNLTEIIVDSGNNSYASQDGVLFSKNLETLICCPEGKTGTFIIPDDVKIIEYGTFYNCNNLISIVIPNSVTSIGDSAFYGCDNLMNIHYKGTKSEWNKISIGDFAIPSDTMIHYKSEPAKSNLPTIRGDVDGNNTVEVSDAVEILNYYSQKAAGLNPVFSETATENEAIFKLADINNDNEITVQDAVLILTYYAKTASGGQPTWEELTSA